MDHGQVRLRIHADQLRRIEFVVVNELDLDLAGALDHVMVRDDVPLGVDNHTGALPRGAPARGLRRLPRILRDAEESAEHVFGVAAERAAGLGLLGCAVRRDEHADHRRPHLARDLGKLVVDGLWGRDFERCRVRDRLAGVGRRIRLAADDRPDQDSRNEHAENQRDRQQPFRLEEKLGLVHTRLDAGTPRLVFTGRLLIMADPSRSRNRPARGPAAAGRGSVARPVRARCPGYGSR